MPVKSSSNCKTTGSFVASSVSSNPNLVLDVTNSDVFKFEPDK